MMENSYVYDESDSSRHYRSIYRVVKVIDHARVEVQRVGQLVNGRLETWGDRGVTHRVVANLREWTP